jgi:cell division protein FtsL
MSAPARKLQPSPGKPSSKPTRKAPAPPMRRPATSAPRSRRPASRRRARRLRLRFAVVIAAIAVPLIVGLVSLNAVLAQTSFTVDALTTRVNTLQQKGEELRKDVALLSAPDRVSRWALRQHMVTPDPRDIHVLRPPAHGSGSAP